MQIVINIDEVIYKRILPYKDVPVISNLANDLPELMYAVANGVPLPKGHGRLIDADLLLRKHHIDLKEIASTIIEADGSEEDG